jgi:rhodanese-related sulfurtransferase
MFANILSQHTKFIINYMDISVTELQQKLHSGESFVFIDVREPYEYEEFNLGAQLMPLGEVMNRAWELEEHKNHEIVVHCRSGKRSGMAQQMLQAAGFTNVRNVEGGVLAWIDTFGAVKPS